jgi:hypothetical protein
MNNTGMLYVPPTSVSRPLTANPMMKQAQSRASTIYTSLNALSGRALTQTKAQLGMLKPSNTQQLVQKSSKPGGNAGGKH